MSGPDLVSGPGPDLDRTSSGLSYFPSFLSFKVILNFQKYVVSENRFPYNISSTSCTTLNLNILVVVSRATLPVDAFVSQRHHDLTASVETREVLPS